MRGLGAVVILAACGEAKEAAPCTVEDLGSEVAIECPDGSRATVGDGPAGADGANGANGQDGQDGTNNRIAATHFCQGALENTTMGFVYQVAVMAAGDVFAYGAVRTAGTEAGASTYYSVGQVGALDAKVFFFGDYLGTANGGRWEISLNRSTQVALIAYYDVDAVDGLMSWTMQPSACTRNQF